MTIEITGHVEDPHEYNRKIRECRSNPLDCGCISTWACESCGTLNSDGICLCMGIFTCAHCGAKNDFSVKGFSETEHWYVKNSLQSNLIFYVNKTMESERLKKEARFLLSPENLKHGDSDLFHCQLFDFVVKVAKLDEVAPSGQF